MNGVLDDFRFAWRMFAKSPVFTAIAVATLALGIGANTAIFSVVNAVLFNPIPYPEPERLVIYWERNESFGEMSIAYPNYLDWRREAQAMEELAVYRRDSFNLTGAGDPEQVRATMVSDNVFRALQVKPLLGREFTPDEDQVGGDRVTILTHAYWQNRFGGDPAVLGRDLILNGQSYRVVGIMPPDLRHPTRSDLFLPIGQFANSPGWENRGNHPGIYGFGRIAPGVTLEAAQQEIAGVAQALEKQYPDSNSNNTVEYASLPEYVVSGVRPALYLLTGAVALVLLIACVNVANLLLARAAGRQRELSVRAALGAGRWRVTRQLLTESLLLALLGGALGVVLAYLGVDALTALYAPALPAGSTVAVDGGVLAFTVGLSVFTGLGFGLAPALAGPRRDLSLELRAGSRGGQSVERRRAQSGLAVAEIALAIVLMVGAGLLIRSFTRVLDVDPGFSAADVLTVGIKLPQEKYGDDDARRRFWNELLPRVRALPGVTDAGITNNLPFVGGNQTSFAISGQPMPEVGQDRPFAEYGNVDPGYFATLEMRLLRGRLVDASDRVGSPRTMVIDEQFARRHWPDADPIGQAIVDGNQDTPENRITVVGVVGTVRHNGLDVEPPRPQMYFPAEQSPPRDVTLVVKTAVPPETLMAEVRRTVRGIDADQPVSSVRPMQSIIDDSLAQRRLTMSLLGTFAALAAVLALVGIYGVISYGVARRTQELGVRIALGAQAAGILGLVLREVALLAGVGVALGIVGALGLGRLIESQLYGVSAWDPATFMLVAAAILAATAAAALGPARRAMRVDPMVALREE